MQQIGKLNNHLKQNPYIYRIDTLNRFYEMLNKQEMVFVNPDLWEDPLENLIFNAKIFKNNKLYKNPVKDRIFSQCWSYNGDSYAMWKIYTTKPNENNIIERQMGVRLTTRLDLLNNLEIHNPKNHQFFYGLVRYKWKKYLDKIPKDPRTILILNKEIPSKEHLETLLIKRKSYSYEKELRLFCVPDISTAEKTNNRLCRIKFKPKDFFTSIRFDPGMEYKVFKKHKNRLIKQYGFDKSQITQSTYFKKNNYVISMD